jgi:hypothetical protein
VEVEVKSRRIAKFASVCTALAVALVIAACGEDRTGTIPTPTNPEGGFGGNIPKFDRNGNLLPDFSTGAQINVADITTYSGVEDIMKPDLLVLTDTNSIVGNPLIRMDLNTSTTSTTAQKVFLFVEDAVGGWAAEIPEVKGTQRRTSTALDIIFSDDYLTVRVVGSISSGRLAANIFYRVRATGEEQCLPRGTLDIATPCRDAYMYTGNTSFVKRLGSFSATYANWLK